MHVGKSGEPWFTLNIRYPKDDIVIDISSAYLPLSENKIAIISIDTQALPTNLVGQIYGDRNYEEFLAAYTLPQILESYGLPDEVFFTADIYEYEKDAPDFFEIRLLYLDKGIFARYTMPAELVGDVYKFCPANSFVDLDLIANGLDEDYQELLLRLGDTWRGFFPPSPFHKKPEEAIGMTIEEFHESLNSFPSLCLESPQAIWPGR